MKRIAVGKTLLACFALSAFGTAHAQGMGGEWESSSRSNWYFGVGGGYRLNKMSYSNLDKDIFRSNKMTGSGVFSVFVNGEFGRNRQFGIRPQLSFLNRGGKLSELFDIDDNYEENNIQNMFYTIDAHYIDVRVPLIYNFCSADACVRPYAFVAPVLGFSTGGKIKLQSDMTENRYAGYELGATKANLNSTYFAGQVGAGVKFAIPVASTRCYLGVEVAYEYGFTDTYASKEKNSEANDILHLFNDNYQIDGHRKFSGVEVQAMLAVPFDIFKSKPAPREPEPAPVARPVVYERPVEQPAKPCYTLEEIDELIAKNQPVDGKTICAIDAINFEFGKSVIKAESFDYLNKLAKTLKRTNHKVEIKGHTDNIGTAEFNMNLSRERAQAVRNYLVNRGVSSSKLSYSYYGMTRPLTTNATEEGRAQNRRVEFTIH